MEPKRYAHRATQPRKFHTLLRTASIHPEPALPLPHPALLCKAGTLVQLRRDSDTCTERFSQWLNCGTAHRVSPHRPCPALKAPG